jgi:membrane-associated protease RseP (regulator of RpoE activity)
LVLLAVGSSATRPARAAGGGPHGGARGGAAIFYIGSRGSGAPSNGAPTRNPQGYLGVDLRDVGDEQVSVLKLKEARGAEIVLVDHDAPAGKAGLREHDVVLQMNGQAIESGDQIRRMLRESPPGKSITLLISRDGQQITVTARMANREEVERQAWEQHIVVPEPQSQPQPQAADSDAGAYAPAPSAPAVHAGNSFIGTILMTPAYTGAMLEQMSPQLAQFFGAAGGKGLLVRSVADNSPASQAGMHAGDVVIQADSQKIANTGDWTKAIKNSHGHPLTVTVLRDKKEQTLTLTPDPKRRSSLEPLDNPQPGDAIAHLGPSWMPQS